MSSQLPRIREHERRDAAGVLVENQRSRQWRLGTLAAVLTFAKPAVDADRRTLGLLQIKPSRIDQPRCIADFTAQTDRKPRLRLWVRRDGTAHGLRDREIAAAVRQL